MRILGLHKNRLKEWLLIVRTEGRRLGPWAITKAMITAVRGGLVDQATWRHRMKRCAGCPVYDKARHACRDTDGMGLGCGCWMPFKAMFRGPQCWARAVDPNFRWGHER